MARLGIRKVDAIEKNCDLVERTATDRDIRLCTSLTSLTAINASGIV